MRRKRILLVIPELIVGGAQRSLSRLSVELARHHDVWIAVFNKETPVAYTFGGTLLTLDVYSGEGITKKIKAFRQRILRLREIKRQYSIEVAISFLEGADYINVLSKGRERVVLSIRGSKKYDENIGKNFAWLRRRVFIPRLYRRADLVVTVNHGIAQELKEFGVASEKIFVIGNFYDMRAMEEQADEPKNENLRRLYEHPVIVSTGRLAPEKGLPVLMGVFSELKKRNTTLRFVIVGEGPLKQVLMDLAQTSKLSVTDDMNFLELPDVLFTGNQANVYKFLRGAALYVMNSSNEGFPNGLAEAMICGVPVVSSDCPYGPREIMAPEFPFISPVAEPYVAQTGILLPLVKSSREKQMWVDTISDLVKDHARLKSMAALAKERISVFDRNLSMTQWNKLLK